MQSCPTGHKSKTQLEAFFKRDPPNTKTWRNSLRGQKMDSAGLGYKSTGGAVGSVIREKVQSARKWKIPQVCIYSTAELQNSRVEHSHNYSCRFQHSPPAAGHPTVLDRALPKDPVLVFRSPGHEPPGRALPTSGGRSQLAIHPKWT